MKKELIICIVIIILIILGNILTEKYTSNSAKIILDSLSNLKENIMNDFHNVDREKVLEEVKNIKDEWKSFYYLMAYYIEHDELEKIETSLIGIESYIESEEYGEGIAKIDETAFILQHIEKKYNVSLQNIF